MTMTFTNDKMAQAIDAMTGLNETGKLGYAIARNLRKMKEECTEYLGIRVKAFQTYGRELDNGKVIIPADKVGDFLADTQEIGQIEHDVDIYQVPEECFLGGTLTSAQMESLLWMVSEDE